ncbi:MAG: hypothetical protein JNK07_13895 [Alphaproteobacteria bacterium]|nr:hypothetical protein [Alphaproteobacteria bacterium]
MTKLTRRTMMIATPLALAAAAAATRAVAQSATYTGTYVDGFEVQSFIAEGSKEAWWLEGSTDVMTALRAPRPAERKSFSAYRIRATVEGTLSEPGAYGHLGAYKRKLTVTRVISAAMAG